MSETYHSTFGQQIFTDVSASGSSSGRDRFEMLDATTFYHNDRDYQAPGTLRLSGQENNYAHGHPFTYASHNGPPSLPSKRAFSHHVLSLRTISSALSIIPGQFFLLHSLLVVCTPILHFPKEWERLKSRARART
jgi:hypothetical protein